MGVHFVSFVFTVNVIFKIPVKLIKGLQNFKLYYPGFLQELTQTEELKIKNASEEQQNKYPRQKADKTKTLGRFCL